MSGANECEAPIFRLLREDAPNPKQIQFFEADKQHICYGGARGGGKSWAMRRKFVMLSMRYAGLKLLLLRRTMPELRRNHILPLQGELKGYAQYKADERAFLFPNGSRLELGYCDNEGDVLQYQGAEYDVIGFEEATLFPEEWIVMITTSARTTRADWRVRFYYTCNPGGVGHAYIKRLFLDRVYKPGEDPDAYVMIRATVKDNFVLMERDPDYVKRLEALPPMKRRAHLEGDWSVYEGQVFEEWTDDPAHYGDRRYTHVISPFAPPKDWRYYRSFDFGYAKPFSVGWWAVDYDGRFYRILELYGCVDGEPNTGVRWTPDEIFREIARLEDSHPWLAGRKILGVADPSIWDASRGRSIADEAEKHRIYFEPGDNERLPGWMQLHYRLSFDENGIPMLYVFENCKDAIRTLPLLQYDKHHVEDVDTDGEDHIADEMRYLCQMNPMKPVAVPEKKPRVYDPLSTDGETRYDRYEFYSRF
jgi:hypothetical protein